MFDVALREMTTEGKKEVEDETLNWGDERICSEGYRQVIADD